MHRNIVDMYTGRVEGGACRAPSWGVRRGYAAWRPHPDPRGGRRQPPLRGGGGPLRGLPRRCAAGPPPLRGGPPPAPRGGGGAFYPPCILPEPRGNGFGERRGAGIQCPHHGGLSRQWLLAMGIFITKVHYSDVESQPHNTTRQGLGYWLWAFL